MKCKLERILREMGTSSYRFSKTIGIPYSTFRSWVTGRTCPNPYNIDVLCTILKVQVGDLFEHEPAEIPYEPVLKSPQDVREQFKALRTENIRLKARLKHENKKKLAKLPSEGPYVD